MQESLSRLIMQLETTYVANNQVDMVVVATEGSVQVAGPNLCVGRQSPGLSADDEAEWLEVLVLIIRQA